MQNCSFLAVMVVQLLLRFWLCCVVDLCDLRLVMEHFPTIIQEGWLVVAQQTVMVLHRLQSFQRRGGMNEEDQDVSAPLS